MQFDARPVSIFAFSARWQYAVRLSRECPHPRRKWLALVAGFLLGPLQ